MFEVLENAFKILIKYSEKKWQKWKNLTKVRCASKIFDHFWMKIDTFYVEVNLVVEKGSLIWLWYIYVVGDG